MTFFIKGQRTKKYLICSFFILLTSCNKSPTNPSENALQFVDLTKLHWTVDTLKIDDPEAWTTMHAIWGSASDDIWVGGDHLEIFSGKLWHYDGKTWRKEHTPGMNGLEIAEIWGFSSDDIWAVGRRYPPYVPGQTSEYQYIGVILHYDGTEWTEVNLPKQSLMVSAIGGTGPNDIYAGGGPKGTMYHYDGIEWMLDSIYIPVEFSPTDGNQTAISRITRNPDSGVYLLQRVWRDWEFLGHPYLYRRENETWVLKDSANYNFYFNTIWMSPEENLYLVGPDLSNWTPDHGFLDLPDKPPSMVCLGVGGWDNNLLVCGRSNDQSMGLVYHFDGSNWTPIKDLILPDMFFLEPFFVDDTVFLRAVTGGTSLPIHTYIFKGTL